MLVTQRDLKNSLYLFSGESVARFLTLVLTVLLARYLGVADFGKYCTALSFVMVFSIGIDLGLATLTFRELSKDGTQADRFIANGLVLEFLLALVLTIMVFATAAAMGYSADTRKVIGILWLWVVGVRWAGLIRIVFKSRQRMDVEALLLLLEAGVKFLLVYLALRAGQGLGGAATMIALSAAATLMLCILFARTGFLRFRFAVDLAFMRKLAKSAFPFALTIILTSSLYRLDTILLSVFEGDIAVGIYNSAYRLVLALFFLPLLICQVYFPKLTQYAAQNDDTERFSRLTAMLFKYMFVLIYPLSMGLFIMASPIVRTLYTDAYFASSVYLKILSWVLLLYALNNVAIYCLNAAGVEKKVAGALGGCLATNLVLNLVLIPSLGAVGAAVSILASQASLLLLLARFLNRLLPAAGRFLHRGQIPYAVVTLLPLGSVLIGVRLGVADSINFILFTVVYALCLLFSRLITAHELGNLRDLILYRGMRSPRCSV
jgi:O-antigen/teichoic acid export membrane protein